MSALDFICRKIPFYVLYVASYGYMITSLYIYGQMMGDHVFFLLYWVTIVTFIFTFIFYNFYEMDDNPSKEFTKQHLISIFYCQKRGILTPFFVMGALSSINYILAAAANPHVKSLDQVLASVLQLPVVILFNRWLNNEYLWNYNKPNLNQILMWLGIVIFFLFGVLLTAETSINGQIGHVGWFICYVLSTFPLPMLSVVYQSLVTVVGCNQRLLQLQPEMNIYCKRSLMITMLNFWQFIWLLCVIWMIPDIDGTGIGFSIRSGMSCVIAGNNSDSTNDCIKVYLDLSVLTLCVIFNFYAGIKVVSFDDANFAILVQQLGPILAAFMFSDKQFMGKYYDLQHTTWRSYVAIASIIISFIMYKYHKIYIKDENYNNNNNIKDDKIGHYKRQNDPTDSLRESINNADDDAQNDAGVGVSIEMRAANQARVAVSVFERIWVLDKVLEQLKNGDDSM